MGIDTHPKKPLYNTAIKSPLGKPLKPVLGSSNNFWQTSFWLTFLGVTLIVERILVIKSIDIIISYVTEQFGREEKRSSALTLSLILNNLLELRKLVLSKSNQTVAR